MDTEQCAEKLKWFAKNGCRGQSQLYEHLSSSMAEDDRLLEIVRSTPDGQPIPNLILAAVHFLLLGGVEHELANFYPSCVDTPLPADGAFAVFREFCLEHEHPIRELLTTRRVQTNEVRRCAYLFPAFSFISQHTPENALVLIEVGSSAGLLLNWDRYAYDFGTGKLYGDPNARVRIQSEWRGTQQPPLTDSFPKVVDRVGIDLHIVDVNDPQQALWLRSLVWPDQPHRMKRINDAIDEFKSSPVRLIEGDGFDVLPTAIEGTPEESTICVFHCHTLNQFSDTQRQQFDNLLADISKQHSLIQLSAEWSYAPQPQLRMIQWNDGLSTETLLAHVDHHGRWIEWMEKSFL